MDFSFVDKIEYKKNPIVVAYKRGYRFKNGKLYLKGKKVNLTYQYKYLSFNISLPRINPKKRNRSKIILFKYFAFQEFGEDVLLSCRIKAKDDNYQNFTRDNILILKFEYLQNQIIKNKYVAANRSGYYVTAKGRLKFRGYDHEVCVHKDKDNYKYFKFENALLKNKSVYIHKLQAYQKYGFELFKNKIVRHLDDDSSNNNYDNILIGDYYDNYNDRREHTLLSTSIKKTKWNIDFRQSVRNLMSSGYSSKDIGEIFGVNRRVGTYILNNKTQYEKYLERKNKI